MERANKQLKVPAVAPTRVLNQTFIWINTKRGLIRTRKFSGVSSVLMLPVFVLGFVFLALIIALLLTLFLVYVMFYLIVSLPRLKKASRPL